MVDKDARKRALIILNRLETERLTNWQIEDEWPTSKSDPAINCILMWLWTLYDDNAEYVLIDKLSNAEKVILKRCCDFLDSEIEFPTKELSFWAKIKMKVKWGMEWRSDCTFPNDDCWPFPAHAEGK